MSTFQRQQINIFTAHFTYTLGISKALAIAPFMHLNVLQSQKGATYQARLSDTATEVRESLLSTQTTSSSGKKILASGWAASHAIWKETLSPVYIRVCISTQGKRIRKNNICFFFKSEG